MSALTNAILLHHILLLLNNSLIFRNRSLRLIQFGPQLIADHHQAIPLSLQLANLIFAQSKFSVHVEDSSLLLNDFLLELEVLAIACVTARWHILLLIFDLLENLLHFYFHDLNHGSQLFIFDLE